MKRRREGTAVRWRPPKRARWTAEDGRAMLSALESSDMSASAFAREVGVGLHRVRYWRQRLGGKDEPRRMAGFVPVRVREAGETTAPAEGQQVEVELSNGRQLRFSGSWTAASIAPWLQALEGRQC